MASSGKRETGTIGDVATMFGVSRFVIFDLLDRKKVEFYQDERGQIIIFLDSIPKRQEWEK